MPSYLTTSDVATRLGVSLDTVRRWLRSGELKGTPFGRAGYRIDDADFQAFLALRRRQSQEPFPSFPEHSSRSNAALDERMERKSRAEYFALLENDPEHRYEYLDGYIYIMTGGSPDHSIIGNNIGRILGNLLQGRRCIVYNSDLYVELSDNYRVCPDATVSCDPRDRGSKDAIRYPCLVVEVLFPATEARDRGKKSLQYRSCPTIQEYLLINADSPIIEVFRREKNGFWTLYTLGQDDTIELPNLGIHFPVAEVYQNTSFEEE